MAFMMRDSIEVNMSNEALERVQQGCAEVIDYLRRDFRELRTVEIHQERTLRESKLYAEFGESVEQRRNIDFKPNTVGGRDIPRVEVGREEGCSSPNRLVELTARIVDLQGEQRGECVQNIVAGGGMGFPGSRRSLVFQDVFERGGEEPRTILGDHRDPSGVIDARAHVSQTIVRIVGGQELAQ